MNMLQRSLRHLGLTCALTTALSAFTPTPFEGLEDAKIHWRGKAFGLDELPEDFPAAARSALEVWQPWATKMHYTLHLDPPGRVLLVSNPDNGRVEKQLELIDQVGALFEKHMPLPDPALAIAAPDEDEAQDAKDEPLPEDPEGGPYPWEEAGLGEYSTDDGSSAAFSYSWGAVDMPPDASTIVFLVVRDAPDFAQVLDFLAEHHPYLADWTEEAKGYAGFSLQQPLAGAFIQNDTTQEEWNPDNEVVNRMAQLFLLRRFGQQPNWLVQGWAWFSEFDIQGGVYCFPYRNEFVFATEHSGWDTELANRFENRQKKPLRTAEFAKWERGSYESDPAKISWGVIEYMTRFRPGELSLVASEFRTIIDKESRVDFGDGTWERNLDYTLPVSDQDDILREHLGGRIFREITDFFRKRDRYVLKSDD